MDSDHDVAVLGIDPGARWTAGVLRVGDAAVTGWTVGPGDDAARLADPDDVAAVAAYVARVTAQVEATMVLMADYPRRRLAVEMIRVPVGWRYGKRTSVRLTDWLVPRQVGVAIIGRWPTTRLIAPDRHGRRELADYPAELRRRRPPGWPPNEAPRGERDHERAAFDVAGVAARMP
ncbi:hypothetical protein [Salinispora arenicola]|uniref:hypothetical protein n=1 Tax=Salinispora arenicola TaxID=168697 RepID=UPI0003AB0716|nr:hypothetical protein [Salinispora arenicola]